MRVSWCPASRMAKWAPGRAEALGGGQADRPTKEAPVQCVAFLKEVTAGGDSEEAAAASLPGMVCLSQRWRLRGKWRGNE